MAINEDFSIIQGPPGTGKTLTIAAIVINWLRSDAGSFI
jgi:KaiC/GvpD/RAD55 family RecA-like ATPase